MQQQKRIDTVIMYPHQPLITVGRVVGVFASEVNRNIYAVVEIGQGIPQDQVLLTQPFNNVESDYEYAGHVYDGMSAFPWFLYRRPYSGSRI